MSVRHALLALLAEGPSFGLRLQQEFESRTGEVWPLNAGQVYTTLQRLERDGLVASDGGESGQQRDYSLTVRGRDELEDWLRTPAELEAPPRDELVIKVLVATTVSGIDVSRVIQDHRRQLVEEMQRYTRVKANAASDEVALGVIVDAELFRLEGVIRWLDSADARLKSMPDMSAELGTLAPTPVDVVGGAK